MQDGYITKDLGEAAALISTGCELTTVHWKDQIGYFQFAGSPATTELSRAYYAGTLSVSARNYYDNLQLVKRKIRSEATPKTRPSFRTR